MRLGGWRQDLPPQIQEHLAPRVPDELRKGWLIGRDNFGDRIHFYAPTLKHYETSGFRNSAVPFFVPVSITGGACKLQCEHCRGQILKTMHEASSPDQLLRLARRLWEKGGRGLLISGGSLADGTVPLHDYVEVIGKLKQMGFQIAVHTGLVDEKLARGLAGAGTDIAMIDVIGSNATIRDVYHLEADTTDYERSLELLTSNGVRTAPHVVIGLDFGEIKGEMAALRMISRHPVDSLVLVVVMPGTGTPMQDVTPPSPQRVGEIFLTAREMFPRTPILLGCARPFGDHKLVTDALALKSGLNGIAYPAEGITELAAELGLKATFSEQCCALIYQDAGKEDQHENMAVTGHGSPDGG
ncbi:MAG: radical SAM protein [Thermoleophilia bacterium]